MCSQTYNKKTRYYQITNQLINRCPCLLFSNGHNAPVCRPLGMGIQSINMGLVWVRERLNLIYKCAYLSLYYSDILNP